MLHICFECETREAKEASAMIGGVKAYQSIESSEQLTKLLLYMDIAVPQ